jgi:hypothetical protein
MDGERYVTVEEGVSLQVVKFLVETLTEKSYS